MQQLHKNSNAKSLTAKLCTYSLFKKPSMCTAVFSAQALTGDSVCQANPRFWGWKLRGLNGHMRYCKYVLYIKMDMGFSIGITSNYKRDPYVQGLSVP